MRKYYIAGINLSVEFIDDDYFSERFKEYEKPNYNFKFDNYGNNECVIIMKNVEKIDTNEGKIISQKEYSFMLKTENTSELYFNNGNDNVIRIKNYSDYDRVEIDIVERLNSSPLNMRDLEYIYLGSAFNKKVGSVGGMMIHSSSIAYNDSGLLFSAPCGTGKSTHTRLWKEKFGDKVRFINDDKPVIRFVNDMPVVCGTPFSGKSILNSNIQIPMQAYIYLERAENNSIEPMNKKKALFCLSEQTLKTNLDKNVYLRNLNYIEKIIEKTPCFNLKCNPTTEAVDIVYKEIFGNENK